MKLIIVHYHLRPGGVRRIIEQATPYLIRALGNNLQSVVLASGEIPDEQWLAEFKQKLNKTNVSFFVEPAFGYSSEQKLTQKLLTSKIRSALTKLTNAEDASDFLIWFHNPSLGRNPLLSRELIRFASSKEIPVIFHHHDWIFDNRWARWTEMRIEGFRSFQKSLHLFFPPSKKVAHVTINQVDARTLEQCYPKGTHWLPNLANSPEIPVPERANAAKSCIRNQLKIGESAVWLLPCRLLRRKNVAEALLLTRWLSPDAWLVTTGGVSSVEEKFYADKLAAAAHENKWRLKLGCLQGSEAGKPSVPELLAASDAVVLTSIVEGFGLPYLEAALAERPLIARMLANIAADLAKFGFRFPQSYEEILIHPSLFDWDAEVKRQAGLFRKWKKDLPSTCRRMTGIPVVLSTQKSMPVPFSRLTLTAQLQVLTEAPEKTWIISAKLNPFLKIWYQRANCGRLGTTVWPRSADRWLSGEAYASEFVRIAESTRRRKTVCEPTIQAQEQFLAERLDSSRQFPLLWSAQS